MRENPLREVNIALVATTLTLAVAVGLYMVIPRIGLARLMEVTYTHKREFKATPAGGEIVYSGGELARIQEDLEILSRRFERGHFEIVTLPGSKLSPEVAAMKARAASYRYSVKTEGNLAVLRIEGPAEPAGAYLKYLQSNWNQ